MKNILITGGAGFIGSNFIHYLLKKYPEYYIVNLDRLTYAGNPDNLLDITSSQQYVFCQGDICDRLLVDLVLAKYQIDTIVHFAAETHVDRSITGPAVFVQTNVVGTQVLLDASRAHGIERFLHVSTDEVYGSLGATGFFTEETPLHPNSPYSASKASSDMLVLAYHHTFGFPGIVTRCSNNYGPYQFPEKLIPLIITNALNDKPLPVYGDGLNVRDWLYVEDHCSALDTVLHNGRIGDVYNIGGHNEWKNIDIVKLVLKGLGKPESLITYVKDRPGHDRRYAIDSSKLQREFGWSPLHSFEEGLLYTIQWYSQNDTWVNRIKTGAYLQ